MNKIGYKATIDLKCIDLTYVVGETYEMEEIEICKKGFHYCKRIEDTLQYYNLSDGLTFIEIEDLGNSVEEGDKSVTNKMKVLRIIPKDELDWLSKPIRYENSDGTWYTNEYDDNGNLIRHEKSDGYWYTNEYYTNGNLIKFKNSTGYWETHEYDTNDNIIRHEDSSGFWETYEYDTNGNVIKLVASTGWWETKEYDGRGNLIKYIDYTGNWYTKEYDENDVVIKVLTPNQ